MSTTITNVQLFNLLKEHGATGKDIKKYLQSTGKWKYSKVSKIKVENNHLKKQSIIEINNND